MRILVDARYARYLKAEIVILVAKIGRDKAWREEEDDDQIRRWANIPESAIDPDATGDVLIVIDEPDPSNVDVIPLPSPMRAAS